MKKKLLFLVIIISGIFLCGYTQTPVLLIDEDFQDWTATPGLTDTCEEFTHEPGPDTFDINLVTGGKAKIVLIKYAISPLCNSKYVNRGDATENGEGVTTGFVSLIKVTNPGDTLGEFIISKLSNVTTIDFAFSCTGTSRGVRLYKSTDNGATWGEPIGGEHWEVDAQRGIFVTEEINSNNVMLKFTSGTKNDATSQNSRIHNIQVYGVPGPAELGIPDNKTSEFTAYYVSGKGLVIKGDVYETSIYDLMGRMVKITNTTGDQTVDLSNFADGVYVLKAMSFDGNIYVRKFLKK